MNPRIFHFLKSFIEVIKKHIHRGHALSMLILVLLTVFVFFVRIPTTWNLHWYIAYITIILSIIGFLLYRIEFENKIKIPQTFGELKKIWNTYKQKINELQKEVRENNEKIRTLLRQKNEIENKVIKLKLNIQSLKAKSNIALTDQENEELNTNQNSLKEMENKMADILDSLENIEYENENIKENIMNERENMELKNKSKTEYENAKSKEYGYYDSTFRTQIKSYLKSLLLLFGLTSLIVLVGYLYIMSDTQTQSTMASIMSVGFVLISVYLLYRIRYDNNNENDENKFMFAKLLTEPFVLMYNIGYFTYCKLVELINKLLNNDERILLFQSLIKWFNQNKKVFIVIIACVVYLIYEFGKKTLNSSKQLVERPIYLNTSRVIGDINTLYGKSNRRNYSFSLQAWVFIDQNTPSKNMASNTDTTILNYGGVPLVTYNAKNRTLSISIKQGANIQKAIFETQELQLQKWNFLVFNYTNATMDVFLNTQLVATENNIIPFMNKDEIISGSNEGISGGINHVYYSKKPLSTFEILSTYYYRKGFSYFLPINI